MRIPIFLSLILLLSLRLEIFGQTIQLDKKVYLPGSTARVTYNCAGLCKGDAWIGIIPSNIAHGSESTNDQHDLAYQYIGNKNSGTLTFKAPGRSGRYDFRMHNTDGNGKEVATVTFVVSSRGSSSSQQAMSTIYNNWNKTGVQNKPSKAPQINVNSSALISRITNYHWNNGRGKTPGHIWLVDDGGNILGPWQAVGTAGTGGAQNLTSPPTHFSSLAQPSDSLRR